VADYLVLCSAESERQVRAIADHVDHELSSLHHPPLSIEGAAASQWILMDFGDVVAHIFRTDVRAHYGLENLWADARKVRLPDSLHEAAARPAAPPKPRVRRARKQG